MLDFVYFIFEQFFGIFTYLDSIYIVGTLTLFKILLISLLLLVILKFIGGSKNVW